MEQEYTVTHNMYHLEYRPKNINKQCYYPKILVDYMKILEQIKDC